jgi:hypothetical protein
MTTFNKAAFHQAIGNRNSAHDKAESNEINVILKSMLMEPIV